jgi:hypothetical protein
MLPLPTRARRQRAAVQLGRLRAIMGPMARRTAAGWGSSGPPTEVLADVLGRRPTAPEAREVAAGLRSMVDALGPQEGHDAAAAARWRSAADYLEGWAVGQ